MLDCSLVVACTNGNVSWVETIIRQDCFTLLVIQRVAAVVLYFNSISARWPLYIVADIDNYAMHKFSHLQTL